MAKRTHRLEQALDELGETRAFLELLLTAGPVLVLRFAVPARQVSYVSPNVERLTGVSEQEALAPRFLHGRVHLDDQPGFDAALDQIEEGSSAREVIEYRVDRGDGSFRWVSAVFVPEPDGDGRIMAVLGYVIDIDDRHRAEVEKTEAERRRLEAEAERVRLEIVVELERLEAVGEIKRLEAEVERKRLSEKLYQSQRLESLGQLAGGVAHDFNNLLAVISNCALFVGEELDDKEAAQNDLEQIRVAAERAAQLTRQLLAFAGQKVLQPEVFDVNLVIATVGQLLHRTIGEHVELSISLSTDPWLVEADPGQLEQVLVNLAVNARDAMPDGGLLTIDTENIEIDEVYTETYSGLSPGRYVRVRVSDTGSGMEQAVLDHVFEPFFTTKPRGEGTGLGLPTVFGIVAQAGGEIQLYSEPGIGTTCRILLPATDRTPAIGPSPTEARDLHGTETVLLVEDEDPLRDVARRILSRNGYVVLTCANGPEAIAFVESHTGVIDLLLTDVIMPQMLGTEVATRIQEFRPGLPVLYMSGYARPVLGPTLGEEVVLVEKPFSEHLLLIKVRDVLDNVR